MDEAINKLVAALDRHSAALEKFVGAAGKTGAGTTAGSSTTKPGTTKPKAPSKDDIQKAFTEFMSTTDVDERKRRRDIVIAIAGNFGAPKATEIVEGKRQEALDMLAQYESNEDPLGIFGEPGEDGDSPI